VRVGKPMNVVVNVLVSVRVGLIVPIPVVVI
jgi:hypothetical protein